MAKILVTGGAGFIGSNLCHRLLTNDHEVIVYDNMSRSGTKHNLEWLRAHHNSHRLQLFQSDLADYEALLRAADGVQQVFHLAGQVAVTTSVTNPRKDFYDNALGTFNVLEAARNVGDTPIFIYASTNKVYGEMEQVAITEGETRYCYSDLPKGISESMPLDFHSPYGCSKGAGDQYVRDYYRMYGLRTVVMRQSCIYGFRQYGIEDQGWVAWFMIAALKRRPITIYGDGKQVRDILFIEDLLDAYEMVANNIDVCAGQIYNVGGGPNNTLAIWSEFGPILEDLLQAKITVQYHGWRPGDQQVYISDISKLKEALGWEPKISTLVGLCQLYTWINNNMALFEHL